ncbi:MAG: phage tail sheath subtilisin-like domain-containing protein [Selenomonadaceae bacterium]|nr:phage tail sheath subtilisin-like domain-containing protein [Selenomonadaceae bacterium]MBQ9496281.1 phage tail sheath subtilisin-like domain-containing protein [Selenomonadaceae bacterium]
MARRWLTGVVETRPNTYFRTESGDVVAEGAINGVVGVVYKGTWGEANEVVDISVEEMNNLKDIVGTGEGYHAIHQAFLGGALMVRAVRVGYEPTETVDGTTTAVLKTRVILYTDVKTKNADGSETTETKAAMRVWAKCHTSRAFTATVRTNKFTKKRELTIYEGDRVIETFAVQAGSKESIRFVNEINNTSKYFYATHAYKNEAGKDVGVKIKDYSMKKFIAGKNLTTNVAAFADGIEKIEAYDWNTIVATTTANDVQLALAEFVQQCYDVGRFGMAVIGGSYKTSLADHMTYAAAINDWRVVYCPSGWIGLDGVKYGYSALAGRIAGMIAGCESNASITHLVINGAFALLNNYTNGEYIQAEEAGCLMLSKNDAGQIWVDNSINTLVTPGNGLDEGWKKIRRTKCRFELMTRINRTCDKLIGRLNNDAHGRATIITAMTTVIREMIAERKLFNLRWVTNVENTRYAVFQGLIGIGEDNYKASLSNVELAKKFNVAEGLISAVQLGKVYKNVDGQIRSEYIPCSTDCGQIILTG